MYATLTRETSELLVFIWRVLMTPFQLTASSSASFIIGLSLIRPPSSFVNWHESTMWLMVCRCSQSHSSDTASSHLNKFARHGHWVWPVLNWFNSVDDWQLGAAGRSQAAGVPGHTLRTYIRSPNRTTTEYLLNPCCCVVSLLIWFDLMCVNRI